MRTIPLSFSSGFIDFGNLLEFCSFGFQVSAAVCGIGILGFQLPIGLQTGHIQRSGGKGGENGAPRLRGVDAIGISAPAGQCVNVRKCGIDAARTVPHPKLAHTGRIDHKSAVWKCDQFSVRGRMPPFVIVSDLAGGNTVCPNQFVDQRRFADAR